jgi:hypothetical protein
MQQHTDDPWAGWEEADTQVYQRNDLEVALQAARAVLDRYPVPAPVTPILVPITDPHPEEPGDDDHWLLALPPPVRAVLEDARRPARPWPQAPRIRFAVCRPVT